MPPRRFRSRPTFRRPADRVPGDLGTADATRVRSGAQLADQLRRLLLERLDLQAGVQAFTDQDEPAYAQWIEKNFGELRRENEQLDEEVEDLTGAIEEIQRRLGLGFDHEDQQSPAEICDQVMAQIEADRQARENFKTEARRAAAETNRARRETDRDAVDPDETTTSDAGTGLIGALAAAAARGSGGDLALSDSDPADDDDIESELFGGDDEYIEMMFREFMYGIRGIDIDLMDADEYDRARREFIDSFRHARDGNLGDFEKAIRLAGADTSEVNKKAVKSAFRRLAKRLHPDHNPELADDEKAKCLWQEATVANQSLDLSGLDRIELQCILNSGEEITPDLMPRLIDLREWLVERVDDLNEYFDHVSRAPAFGFATSPPPSARTARDTREELQFQIATLRAERAKLRAQIDRLRGEPVRGRGRRGTRSAPPKRSKPAKVGKGGQMEFGY